MSLYANALSNAFGQEWDDLDPVKQGFVLADYAEVVRDDYGGQDLFEDLRACATVYRQRIGKGNLSAYGDTQVARAMRGWCGARDRTPIMGNYRA